MKKSKRLGRPPVGESETIDGIQLLRATWIACEAPKLSALIIITRAAAGNGRFFFDASSNVVYKLSVASQWSHLLPVQIHS